MIIISIKIFKKKFTSKSNKILRFNKICDYTNDKILLKYFPVCFNQLVLIKITNNNQANYVIICLMSQKIISIDEIVSTKNSNIVIDSLLTSDYLIYAGK